MESPNQQMVDANSNNEKNENNRKNRRKIEEILHDVQKSMQFMQVHQIASMINAKTAEVQDRCMFRADLSQLLGSLVLIENIDKAAGKVVNKIPPYGRLPDAAAHKQKESPYNFIELDIEQPVEILITEQSTPNLVTITSKRMIFNKIDQNFKGMVMEMVADMLMDENEVNLRQSSDFLGGLFASSPDMDVFRKYMKLPGITDSIYQFFVENPDTEFMEQFVDQHADYDTFFQLLQKHPDADIKEAILNKGIDGSLVKYTLLESPDVDLLSKIFEKHRDSASILRILKSHRSLGAVSNLVAEKLSVEHIEKLLRTPFRSAIKNYLMNQRKQTYFKEYSMKYSDHELYSQFMKRHPDMEILGKLLHRNITPALIHGFFNNKPDRMADLIRHLFFVMPNEKLIAEFLKKKASINAVREFFEKEGSVDILKVFFKKRPESFMPQNKETFSVSNISVAKVEIKERELIITTSQGKVLRFDITPKQAHSTTLSSLLSQIYGNAFHSPFLEPIKLKSIPINWAVVLGVGFIILLIIYSLIR